eukprot:403362826
MKTTLVLATVLAALLGTSQAMDGLLPTYTLSKKVLDTDYFDMNVRVKSFNGWRHLTSNDQGTFKTAFQMLSEIKVRTQFEFFKTYIYQITTKIEPITITPLQIAVNYQFVSPYALGTTATFAAQSGKIITGIKQINAAYVGSFLDPIFDENTKVEDYTHTYQEPSYFTKTVQAEGGATQLGMWNWDPLSSQAISKTFFTWNVLNWAD